jgi:hypothetical protein
MMSQSKHQTKPPKPTRALPIFWIIGFAVALLFIGVGLYQVYSANAVDTSPGKLGPKLSVNQETIDVGTQVFDKTVRAEFQIRNEGDRALTLDSTTPVKVLEGC